MSDEQVEDFQSGLHLLRIDLSCGDMLDRVFWRIGFECVGFDEQFNDFGLECVDGGDDHARVFD